MSKMSAENTIASGGVKPHHAHRKNISTGRNVLKITRQTTPEEFLQMNPQISCAELDEKIFETSDEKTMDLYARALELLLSKNMKSNIRATGR